MPGHLDAALVALTNVRDVLRTGAARTLAAHRGAAESVQVVELIVAECRNALATLEVAGSAYTDVIGGSITMAADLGGETTQALAVLLELQANLADRLQFAQQMVEDRMTGLQS